MKQHDTQKDSKLHVALAKTKRDRKAWLGQAETLNPAKEEWEIINDLLDGTEEGQRAAAALAIKRYGAEIYRWLFGEVRDRVKADDIFQDFSLSLFLALPKFRWDIHLGPFCHRLARCAKANFFRDKQNQPRRHEPLPESFSEVSILAAEVSQATLAKIRPEQESALVRLRKEVLTEAEEATYILRVGFEFSWNDIALILEQPSSDANALANATQEELVEIMANVTLDAEALKKASEKHKHRYFRAKDKLKKAAQERGLIEANA